MFFAKVRPASFPDSSLRAFADVSIGGVTIKNVKIIEGKDGLFATMPGIKDKSGQYQPVCYVDKDIKQAFNDAVVEAYNRVLEQNVQQDVVAHVENEAQQVEEPDPVLEQTM